MSILSLVCCLALLQLLSGGSLPEGRRNARISATMSSTAQTPGSVHHAPSLGADLSFTEWPHVLIEGWQDHEQGEEMAAAFSGAGLKTLRFAFGGLYSPRGAEATAAVKAENKATNQYPWFSFDDYMTFIAAHDLTTVVGINVEEGPEVAFDVIKRFIARASAAKLTAVELSNEPHLNHRPWPPEEFGKRAADVIERLTPLGVRFALPLTVGKEAKTPTRLSDNEWTARMMRALSTRVDLRARVDIYGVLHLYSRGVGAGAVKIFKRAVQPFAPRMRFLVTEFNIRSSLAGNPHLTNQYAMELARKLAGLMAVPDIEAMYIHAVPYHLIFVLGEWQADSDRYWPARPQALARADGARLASDARRPSLPALFQACLERRRAGVS